MKHSIDCLPCMLRQAIRMAKIYLPDDLIFMREQPGQIF